MLVPADHKLSDSTAAPCPKWEADYKSLEV